jgi:hypothetical protein
MILTAEPDRWNLENEMLHKVRSFASLAARMLRSVRSQWQTGWRALARLRISRN